MVSMIDVYISFRQDGVRAEHSGIGLGIEPAPYRGIRFYVRAPF
jgi:aspartyl/asparaginyl-tRNA synthetase